MLGALVQAGAPLAELEQILHRLEVPGWKLSAEPRSRAGIQGIDLRVLLDDEARATDTQSSSHHSTAPSEGKLGASRPHEQEHGHGHSHSHEHGHSPEHGHEHSHEPPRDEDEPASQEHSHAHRHLPEIEGIIRRASLPPRAEDRALRIFRRLAEAEGRVHGLPPEEVHFHEVGAVDAIVDIVGTAVALELLGVEEIYSSPLSLGTGFVRCEHGMMPVPVPATVELTKGFPVRLTEVRSELCTPTGAAIVTTLARRVPVPAFRPLAVGYGLGDRERVDPPNLLRVVLGESLEEGISSGIERDSVVVLEANLDDCSGEVIGYTIERLFEAGALDAFTIPIQMKKQRPGVLLGVIAPSSCAESLEKLILTETTTLGVRRSERVRSVLPREIVSIETPFGAVSVKRVRTPAGLVDSPEYEDCRRIARERSLPIGEVYEVVRVAARAQRSRK